MKYNINRNEKYSLATIIPKDTPTVSALISIDVHADRKISDQAIEAVYSDAILSGTEKMSRSEFLNAINILGASIGVSVSSGIVTFSLKSREENFKKMMKLFEDMILTPTFKKEELIRIKTTVSNELNQSKEDSKTIAYTQLQNSFYGKGDRKYSFSIEKTIIEVKEVSAKHLNVFHQKVMSQTWFCTIASQKTNCELFEKSVLKIKSKSIRTDTETYHKQKPPHPGIVLKSIPSRTNIDFSIGAPLPITLHHPDFIPLSLGLAVLAKWGGFSGRLMSTVRELEGLTYGIYGKLEGFSGTEQGYWRIMTFFAPDKTLQGLTSTFREISKIYKRGISQVELDKFKTIVNTGQVLLNDSVGSLLNDLHTYHIYGFTLEEMREHKNRVKTLTLKEVNNAIKTYLNPANLTVSGAGPIKAVQKDIKKFMKSMQ